MACQLPPQDQRLVQIVDAALLDAECRSGDWLICKPGCTACCIGVFAIDQLDVLRFEDGLAHLDRTDPERAARVRQRARESWEHGAPTFQGDVHTGVLGDDDDATPDEIAGCELKLDEANALEAKLVVALEETGQMGNTIVAFALAGETVVNR